MSIQDSQEINSSPSDHDYQIPAGSGSHDHPVTKADHHTREFLDAIHEAFNAHPDIPLDVKASIFEHARGVAGGKVKARNVSAASAVSEGLEQSESNPVSEEKAADVADVHVDQPLPCKNQQEKEFESDDGGGCHASVTKSLQIPICKVDPYQHKVAGVVLSPNEIDLQEDIVTAEEIEKASDGYMIRSQTVGKHHKEPANAAVVQNYLAPVEFMLGSQPVKKNSWVMVVKVFDDALWQDVLDGKITGFSIGGKGIRTPAEEMPRSWH